MIYLRLSILFLLATISAMVAHCQPYYFRHYQVENGLSHNTVYCSLQDKDGFMWFGTRDGLNRFDGRNFKVFQHDPEGKTGLKNNLIQSIAQDDAGTIWIGSYRGLYRYNRTTEHFLIVPGTDTIPVQDVEADKNGVLWFISNRMLFRYDAGITTLRNYAPDMYFYATSIARGKDNTIWIGTHDGELKRMGHNPDSFHTIVVHGKQEKERAIESIYSTSDHQLMIGSIHRPMKIVDLKTGLVSPLQTVNSTDTQVFARCFMEKAPGEIWIGTESGIAIFQRATKSLSWLTKNYNDPYALSDNAIYCLTKDREGSVWAGSYFGGINCVPNQKMPFEKFFPDYTGDAINGNAITEICQDKTGAIWIATEDAGINRLDTATKTFRHYKADGKPGSISYFNIHCILVTGDTLWIGTYGQGIDLLDTKTGKVIHNFTNGKGEEKLSSLIIMRLLRTRNGEILIGTGDGLYCYNRSARRFRKIKNLPAETVYSICEDKNGLIWVGYKGQSVYYYDGEKNSSGSIQTGQPDGNGVDMGFNQVTAIMEDSRGYLWFATEGSGIICYDPLSQKVLKRFALQNGLPGNTVFMMLEDEQGSLWITTAKGLVKLEPKTDRLQVFTRANGLLNDQFNYNSAYKTASGRMYFGSIKGLISFRPSELSVVKEPVKLFITDFHLNNKELRTGSEDPELLQSISVTEKIRLSYNQSSFSIDFASLSFVAPEMLQYRYVMSGIDRDWTYLKNNRRVYYTDLPPGHYTFRVQGANSSGIWNDTETQLQIEIVPPLWLSLPAKILYGILVLLAAYLIFRSYHRRSMEKQRINLESLRREKEIQLYHAKMDFFTKIAHEIRTPLTLIKAPLEKVIKRAGTDHPFGNYLNIMSFNTEQLVELTNQFLDFRTTEVSHFHMQFTDADITDLVNQKYLSFKPIAEEKQIQFECQVPEKTIHAKVDIPSMHKILNNLLNNAFNYGEKLVRVVLLPGDVEGSFSIEIANDGFLIPADKQEVIFEPFYRLTESEHISGSGIGLALSKSLAEMQGGELRFENRGDGMNYFVLTGKL